MAEVQAHLDAAAPVTAAVTAYAPIADTLAPTIAVTPNTAAVQAAVQAELEAYVLRTSAPDTTHYLSQINEAISLAAGEVDHTLHLPAADVVVPPGHLLVLGAITWV